MCSDEKYEEDINLEDSSDKKDQVFDSSSINATRSIVNDESIHEVEYKDVSVASNKACHKSKLDFAEETVMIRPNFFSKK